jgi:hypothetical protein
MTQRLHKCAARYCSRKCSVQHLMCKTHWKLVPLPLQLGFAEVSKALDLARAAASPNLGDVKMAYFEVGAQAVKAAAKREKTTWGRRRNAISA